MPTCPKCRRHFRVLEDEDDGQHGCPSCGYGDQPDETCVYCGSRMLSTVDYEPDYPYCSAPCWMNAQAEDEEGVA